MSAAILGVILRSRLFLALVAVGVLFVTLGASADTLSFNEPLPREESYTVGVNTWTGKTQFTSGRGTDDRFIGTWDQTGKSETITLAGSAVAGRASTIFGHQFKIFEKRASGEWILAKEGPQNLYERRVVFDREFSVTLEPWTFTLDGKDARLLRAELWLKVWTHCVEFLTTKCGDVGWEKAAQDGARLVSGVSDLAFDRTSDRYEEGETVRVNVRSDHGTWRLTLFDPYGNAVCGPAWTTSSANPLRFVEWGQSQEEGTAGGGYATTPSSTCSLTWTGPKAGAVEYKLRTGAFLPGTSNVWTYRLDNEVTEQRTLRYFQVDQHEKAPEIPKVTVKSSSGSTVSSSDGSVPRASVKHTQPLTFTFESRANPASGERVSHFLVYVWHGDSPLMPADSSDDWIANGVRVDATDAGAGKYAGSYTYTPKRAANIQSWAVAVDALARPSGTHHTQDQASQQEQGTAAPGEEPNGIEAPNDNSRAAVLVEGAAPAGMSDEPETTASASVLLVLVLALVIAAAAFAIWRFAPLAPHLKAGAIVAVAIVVLFLGGAFG